METRLKKISSVKGFGIGGASSVHREPPDDIAPIALLISFRLITIVRDRRELPFRICEPIRAGVKGSIEACRRSKVRATVGARTNRAARDTLR